MILLLTLVLYGSAALGSWIDEYKNDPREFCPTDLDEKRLKSRIVGGKNAEIGTFPYAVGIIMGNAGASGFRTDNTFCGGTLITDRHVLTAGHCLYNKEALKDYLSVNVNDYDLVSRKERKNYLCEVKAISIHHLYVDKTFDNDIALITTKNSIPFDKGARTAILPPLGRELLVGTICTVWGWGRLSYKGRRSTVMQMVDLPITSREDCQKNLEHRITENMICAGGIEGKDACLGDSGGSLLSTYGNVRALEGIVSFGRGCAIGGVSGVYTKVRNYLEWIYAETRNASCKPRILQ